MSTVQVFSIVMAALVFVWAIVVGVFSGEKYMMWYFRNLGGGSEYDLKKFKVVHACFLMCGAACFLMCGLLEQGPVPLLFLVILMILQQVFFSKVCKKSEEE